MGKNKINGNFANTVSYNANEVCTVTNIAELVRLDNIVEKTLEYIKEQAQERLRTTTKEYQIRTNKQLLLLINELTKELPENNSIFASTYLFFLLMLAESGFNSDCTYIDGETLVITVKTGKEINQDIKEVIQNILSHCLFYEGSEIKYNLIIEGDYLCLKLKNFVVEDF